MADLTVTSDTFKDGDTIPKTNAHQWAGGDNVSPDLSWSAVPEGTQSIAITCWDPDAPTTVGFSHWVMFNIDPATTSLPAGAGAPGKNPDGSVLGFTDFGSSEFGGPAPPEGHGPHHYQFTVWALSGTLDLDDTTTYAKLRFFMGGQTLASGTLVGIYEQ